MGMRTWEARQKHVGKKRTKNDVVKPGGSTTTLLLQLQTSPLMESRMASSLQCQQARHQLRVYFGLPPFSILQRILLLLMVMYAEICQKIRYRMPS